MPDDGSRQSTAQWPTPAFSFHVKWGAMSMTFHEVSGLDMETVPIEYRRGDRNFSRTSMPGLQRSGLVTLTRGIFRGDRAIFDGFRQAQTNPRAPVPVTITLLDETQTAVMVWTIANAFPAKVTSTDLHSDANEVAIDTLEIGHEGLIITNA
jgi:phage tail-like protein